MSSAYEPKLQREADAPLSLARSLLAPVWNVPVLLALALALRTLLQFQIRVGASLGFDRPSLAWSLLALAITGPLGIVIHELGHYLAGITLRQHCRRFVIGPVELAHEASTWSLRLIPIRQAGLVDFVPSTFAQFRLRRAVCVAGGPAASLIAGLAFTAWSFQARTPSLFWIWSDCAQWALIGLLGLIPIARGSIRSDGYLLWELIRSRRTVDEIQRDLFVASSEATPLRLGDWPSGVISRLQADPHAPRYHAYLGYVHYVDRGDHQAAQRCLDRLLSGWTSDDPPEYALEAVWFHALFGNGLPTAKMWLALEPQDAEPWVRLRAEAAVKHAAGFPADARALIDQAFSLLNAAHPCGTHRYEIDRLHEILDTRSAEPDSC